MKTAVTQTQLPKFHRPKTQPAISQRMQQTRLRILLLSSLRQMHHHPGLAMNQQLLRPPLARVIMLSKYGLKTCF